MYGTLFITTKVGHLVLFNLTRFLHVVILAVCHFQRSYKKLVIVY